MISTLRVDCKMRYRDVGKGPVVVLLHGYLESLKIWNGIVDELRDYYRFIIPDLPGQGHSTVSREVQTMDSMAEAVKHLLGHLEIDKCHMVGHSMGGYVTLAFLEKYPKMLNGISLFHSSPYADTEEKKKARDMDINMLNEGRKTELTDAHFPKLFAPENIEKHPKKIKRLQERILKTPDEFIISVLKGMKERPDRAELLKNTEVPIQYIIGAKDNFIPMSILDNLELPEGSDIVILENSGHMGMTEEKKKSVKVLRAFIDNK